MTLTVKSSKVYSDGGAPVTVKGVAQVNIQSKDLASLRAASEMFLDKTDEELQEIAKAILDGHQRSMIASMKIEDIYKNRHKFSKNVQQSTQTDLIDMGLTLISYTIQDISDDEGYLDALGREKTVAVRSEARRGIAIARTFAECNNIDTKQDKMEKEIQFEQSMALKQLEFETAQANYLKEHFENQARSEKVGDLRPAEMNKRIAYEELQIVLLEKEKEKVLFMKKKELEALKSKDKIEMKADFDCIREKQLALA